MVRLCPSTVLEGSRAGTITSPIGETWNVLNAIVSSDEVVEDDEEGGAISCNGENELSSERVGGETTV